MGVWCHYEIPINHTNFTPSDVDTILILRVPESTKYFTKLIKTDIPKMTTMNKTDQEIKYKGRVVSKLLNSISIMVDLLMQRL